MRFLREGNNFMIPIDTQKSLQVTGYFTSSKVQIKYTWITFARASFCYINQLDLLRENGGWH